MRYGMIGAIAAVLMAGCGQWQQGQTHDTDVFGKDCIEARCVATYHHPSAPYWTDQRHRFCPSSVAFEAWGTEPEGAWRFSDNKGQLTTTGLDGAFMKSLPGALMDSVLAKLVYYSFTAGAGFEPPEITPGESVGIEGQRYDSFRIENTAHGHTIILYRNLASGVIEMARITDATGLDWLAYSYNRRFNPRTERMMPRKLDVFDISRGIPAKRLLVEFDYIDVQ